MKKRFADKRNVTKRKMMLAGIFMAACVTFTGCGSDSKSDYMYETGEQNYVKSESTDYGFHSSYDNSYSGSDEGVAEEEYMESTETVTEAAGASDDSAQSGADLQDTGDELSKNTATENKKIIKTYNFSYDTEAFDDAYSYLREQVAAYDGYVSSSNLYGTSRRDLTLTARIPVEKCDEFVNQLGSLGTLVSQSESAEDVTLQYTDTESHITSLETEQDRLNTLLKEADDIESIITLEDRLSDVRYELENYQSQKNLYDDLITYCTVNIELSEVSYTVPVDDSSIFARIKTGLQTTFRDISYDFSNFFVWLIVNLPYLLIWALVIFVIYRIIRRCVRKAKAKHQIKKEQKLARQAQNMQQQNPQGMMMPQQGNVRPQVTPQPVNPNPQAVPQPVNPNPKVSPQQNNVAVPDEKKNKEEGTSDKK